jgi:hypothetical protein
VQDLRQAVKATPQAWLSVEIWHGHRRVVSIGSGRTTLYNTANDFFININPREKWYSGRFNELLLLLGNDLSDRNTAQSLNKIRDQDKGVIPTTIRNHLERNEAAMAAEIKAKAERLPADANFDAGVKSLLC